MCAKPSLDGWTHQRCRKAYGMERLLVGLPYKGVVQECLKKVKYKSAYDIIQFLYKLCDFGQFDNSVITSVPMWNQKERERGFNQAKILSELMGDQVDLLERIRETKPMFGLNKEQRISNIEGAFKINSKSQMGKFSNLERVILVDDVWTTGATMRECARILKIHGAKEVWGVTLAR